MEKLKEIKEATGYEQLELIASEFNSSWGPRDPIHDTYFNATYCLEQIKRCEGKCNVLSYWSFSDLMEEAGVPPKPFHGGFGLLNLQGIKKPIYHLYCFLNKLKGTYLTTEGYSRIIATGDPQTISLIIWDFTWPEQKKEDNNSFYLKPLLPKEKKKIKLILNGWQGRYIYRQYRIGYLENDPFSWYLQIGAPENLSREKEQYLKDSSLGRPVISQLVKLSKHFSLETTLNTNEILFLEFKKIE